MKRHGFVRSGPAFVAALSITVLTVAALASFLFESITDRELFEPPDYHVRLSASFPEGTLIETREGPVPIETIPAGMEILTPGGGWAATAETLVREATGLILLEGEGFILRATPEHPFLLVGGAGSDERPPVTGLPEAAVLDGLRWVAASELREGDVLKTRDGTATLTGVESEEVRAIVYNLSVPESRTFLVGTIGLVAGDAAARGGVKAGTFDGSSGGGGGVGCFPAGTLISTDNGFRSIEDIRIDDRVRSYDFRNRTWVTGRVARLTSKSYNGDIIDIRAGRREVTATGNHPFLVLDGDGLMDRPPAADVPPVERDTMTSGRWVEARHLRLGDALQTPAGEARVDSAISRQGNLTVHNLTIESNANYAVGSGVFLVHNKGASDAERAMPDEAYEEDYDDSGVAEPAPVPKSADVAGGGASGLRAGFADDNAQYGYFTRFLAEYAPQVPHHPMDVSERIVFKVTDRDGKSLPDVEMSVRSGGDVVARGRTYADGTFLFFPSEHGPDVFRYELTADYAGSKTTIDVDRQGPREVTVVMEQGRPEYQQVPLDVLFILDTTGSMGEEIERLKRTIEIIHLNLTSLPARPKVRFGMVLYKDRGDEYITRTVALTEDLDTFRGALAGVQAAGGGDGPEDLQAALDSAIRRTAWTEEGIRLCFVITDADSHLDYRDQSYTYDIAARDAREKGIKIYTVGTGGLPLAGEVMLRQIAQYTAARYIFLTYGETGESEGGTPGSVSHHSGANYETDKLETIIIRFTKEELSYLTDVPLETPDDFFTAQKITDEERDETLRKLFIQACGQLLDYATYSLEDGTPAAVLPIRSAGDGAPGGGYAEYLTERLLLTLRQDEDLRKRFRLTERGDLQAVLDELELQLSGLTDDTSAARVGEVLGAEILFSGSLYRAGDSYELFLKIVRVETAEILSITKAVLDPQLLP